MIIDGVFQVDRLHTSIITIGRRGENLATTIPIDVSAWLAQWPDAALNLLIVRPGDASAYIARTRLEDGILLWPVTATDTERVGHGTFEVRAIAGEVVKKSIVARFKVCPCITCTGDPEPPETARDWVNDVIQAAEEAKEAAERAEDIAEALAGGGSGTGSSLFLPSVSEEDNGKVLTVVDGDWVAGDGGVNFEVDETLSLENGVLSVNRAEEPEPDNTLPITSAAVYTTVGNINALLETI